MTSPEREARLEELFAAGWTTELFAEFWKAPDLKYIPSIITDDVVGHWPGGRIVSGRDEYVKALEDLLVLLPDLWLAVKEHTMSADGEFGFTRWVMHATGAHGPFELDGMDRTRVRDGLVCENYVFFDSGSSGTSLAMRPQSRANEQSLRRDEWARRGAPKEGHAAFGDPSRAPRPTPSRWPR